LFGQARALEEVVVVEEEEPEPGGGGGRRRSRGAEAEGGGTKFRGCGKKETEYGLLGGTGPTDGQGSQAAPLAEDDDAQ
jgi:hypothetical protein